MFSCRGVARPWTCARRRAWAGASSAVRSAGTSTAKVAKKMAKDGKFSQADAANGFKKFRRKGATRAEQIKKCQGPAPRPVLSVLSNWNESTESTLQVNMSFTFPGFEAQNTTSP